VDLEAAAALSFQHPLSWRQVLPKGVLRLVASRFVVPRLVVQWLVVPRLVALRLVAPRPVVLEWLAPPAVIQA
jgi:hypothetical protein